MKQIDESLPKLMRDSSNTDGKAEIVMDYIMSWCLRRAANSCDHDAKPVLRKYCRYMLGLLLNKHLTDDIIVEDVNIKKQYLKIDLWVEVTLKLDDKIEYHTILIENKYYTLLHNSNDEEGVSRNQLEVYKNKFDNYYKEQLDGNKWIKHYNLVTCIERDNSTFDSYKIAETFGFNIFSFDELLITTTEATESDIFNEFWLRSW